jgi:hypothetical protein
MPITFGSVGDIIAVCILVKDCVEALSDTNGSVPQYQAVIRELHILEKALLEVGALSRTHATTPELVALFNSADTTIEQCRKALELFKAKTEPYDQHLGDSSASTTVQKLYKGNAKKLLWQVRMKDEVARFRAEVVAYSVSIDKILAAATMYGLPQYLAQSIVLTTLGTQSRLRPIGLTLESKIYKEIIKVRLANRTKCSKKYARASMRSIGAIQPATALSSSSLRTRERPGSYKSEMSSKPSCLTL